MSPSGVDAASQLDTIESLLVRLRLASALEALRDMVRQLKASELSALELIAQLLGVEHAARDTRRLKAAYLNARLAQPKTLKSFDRTAPGFLETPTLGKLER